jgi:hypothetical protein
MRFVTADQKQQRINVCEELRQIASDDATFLSMVITGDKSWIYGYDPEAKQQSFQCKSPNSLTAKPRACSSFSLTSRELFTKNLSWQAKQSIPRATVTFYGDCMKMCQDFALNCGDNNHDNSVLEWLNSSCLSSSVQLHTVGWLVS